MIVYGVPGEYATTCLGYALEQGYSYAGGKRNAYMERRIRSTPVEIKQHLRETQKLCSTGLVRPNRQALGGGCATTSARELLMSAPIPRLGSAAWRRGVARRYATVDGWRALGHVSQTRIAADCSQMLARPISAHSGRGMDKATGKNISGQEDEWP